MREKRLYKKALLEQIKKAGAKDLGRHQLVCSAGTALGLQVFNPVTGVLSADLNPIYAMLDHLLDKKYIVYAKDTQYCDEIWKLTAKGRRCLSRLSHCVIAQAA
jgi:hypothetical protein